MRSLDFEAPLYPGHLARRYIIDIPALTNLICSNQTSRSWQPCCQWSSNPMSQTFCGIMSRDCFNFLQACEGGGGVVGQGELRVRLPFKSGFDLYLYLSDVR